MSNISKRWLDNAISTPDTHTSIIKAIAKRLIRKGFIRTHTAEEVFSDYYLACIAGDRLAVQLNNGVELTPNHIASFATNEMMTITASSLRRNVDLHIIWKQEGDRTYSSPSEGYREAISNETATGFETEVVDITPTPSEVLEQKMDSADQQEQEAFLRCIERWSGDLSQRGKPFKHTFEGLVNVGYELPTTDLEEELNVANGNARKVQRVGRAAFDWAKQVHIDGIAILRVLRSGGTLKSDTNSVIYERLVSGGFIDKEGELTAEGYRACELPLNPQCIKDTLMFHSK